MNGMTAFLEDPRNIISLPGHWSPFAVVYTEIILAIKMSNNFVIFDRTPIQIRVGPLIVAKYVLLTR